jgi:two-component system, chemotaxis family, CheB/CheR fusion protein
MPLAINNLQSRVIALFHYALASKGILFLGSSESVGEFVELYQRKDNLQVGKLATLARFLSKSSVIDAQGSASGGVRKNALKPSLRELTEQALVDLLAPVVALANSQGDILYLHGRSGLFLEPSRTQRLPKDGRPPNAKIELHD